jgi:predicted lysophospholipase L1 biosynthesis ABC-type transport system permease subunit
MAARYWGSASAALGRRFHIGTADQPWATIVGVVVPVRHNAVVEAPRAEMYLSHAQWPVAGGGVERGMTFVMRTTGDPLALVGAVRANLHAMDAALPVSEIRTLRRVAEDALSVPRFTTVLLSLFAALALTLATVGLYGVISLLVTRRRHEIGIRMALGATRTSIQRMVLARGGRLALSGITLGLAGAIVSSRVLASILYGVTPLDLATYVAVPTVIALVALLACLLPATRAASVNPVIALRDA